MRLVKANRLFFLVPFLVPNLCACGGAEPPAQPSSVTAAPRAIAPKASPRGFQIGGHAIAYPETKRAPVSDSFHGVAVSEDYRWLEHDESAEVKAWSDAQSKLTQTTLESFGSRDLLKARISKLLSGSSPDYLELTKRGNRLFALKHQPPKQQNFLVTIGSLPDTASERVVLDPNVLDPSGKTTIDWFVPSRDGKRVAVSLSLRGSENGDVHVFDVATGKDSTRDVVTHAQNGTGGGSLAWNAEGTGFWYTRYPRGTERPKEDHEFYQQLYFHTLGTSTDTDAYSLGEDFPKIAEVDLQTSESGDVFAQVANGDGGEVAHYVLPKANAKTGAVKRVAKKEGEPVAPRREDKWIQVSKFTDLATEGHLSRDGKSLYLLSRSGGASRGKLLRVQAPEFSLAKAEVLVPESEKEVIERFVVTDHRIYLNMLSGGPSELRFASIPTPLRASANPPVMDAPKELLTRVALPPVSSIRSMVALEGDDLLVKNEAYTMAPAFYRLTVKSGGNAKDNELKKTQLAQTLPFDFADAEVERVMCSSKDGTKVPLNLVKKKGVRLDGNNPVLLTGYGGYGVNRVPRVRPMNRLWLDLGGVVAEANLRGGGEYGDAWHKNGALAAKQNVFDDFAACAQWFVDNKYTKPSRLAIMGGSNGGLLMGAELVQHPEMFRAVVALVGIYDMLRVELTPNGAFNVTEFGTVKDPALFKALHAYSPYHHVEDGKAYPSVLFMTGANDPRVAPYNSRKMAARLQAASSSGHPILLRTSGDTGHGMGTPLAAEIEEAVDIYTFLSHELEIDVQGLAVPNPN